MEKTEFLEELKDALMIENDSFNEETELNMTSLTTLSVIALIDENFDMQIKASDLAKITKAKEIINLIGPDRFK